ncbi:porin [Enterovibrio sp. ZSDZ42]|uniref:Porin n=1 Tax=Enterovibrio gelatinilyticus TaxID=2899819 RepID=A0ABT5QXV8_9GAMM|nr:porin [Enterovibrio sp. ZSDZ42]MDD1792856.1 porin [Enterovibrio sp. ZSDZ42]
MNNTFLTTAILGSLISSTSYAYTVYSTDESSLTVTGRIEARFNVSDANKLSEDGNTEPNNSFDDISRIRGNIDGNTQVTDSIKVFGYYSGEIYSDSSDSKNRYMYVGVGTSYGAFSYGQQDSSQVILTNVTDIMETFGGSASDIITGNEDELENNFVYLAQLPLNMTATVNYVRDDSKGNYSAGGSMFYSAPIGLQLGVGYVSGEQNNLDAEQYNITAAYTLGGLYIGGVYVNGEVDHTDVSGFEIATAYTVNDFIFRYVYNYRTSDFPASQRGEYSVNYNAVEGVYNVTSDFVAYAGYEFNRLDGQANDDQFQAGARYMF